MGLWLLALAFSNPIPDRNYGCASMDCMFQCQGGNQICSWTSIHGVPFDYMVYNAFIFCDGLPNAIKINETATCRAMLDQDYGTQLHHKRVWNVSAVVNAAQIEVNGPDDPVVKQACRGLPERMGPAVLKRIFNENCQLTKGSGRMLVSLPEELGKEVAKLVITNEVLDLDEGTGEHHIDKYQRLLHLFGLLNHIDRMHSMKQPHTTVKERHGKQGMWELYVHILNDVGSTIKYGTSTIHDVMQVVSRPLTSEELKRYNEFMGWVGVPGPFYTAEKGEGRGNEPGYTSGEDNTEEPALVDERINRVNGTVATPNVHELPEESDLNRHQIALDRPTRKPYLPSGPNTLPEKESKVNQGFRQAIATLEKDLPTISVGKDFATSSAVLPNVYSVPAKGGTKLLTEREIEKLPLESQYGGISLSISAYILKQSNFINSLAYYPPKYASSINTICLIESPKVTMVDAVFEDMDDFEMCHLFCKLQQKNGGHTTNSPLYRSTIPRSPVFDYSLSAFGLWIQDRAAGMHPSFIEKCWSLTHEEYMEDNRRKCLKNAVHEKAYCGLESPVSMSDNILVPAGCNETGAEIYKTTHINSKPSLKTDYHLCVLDLKVCYKKRCKVEVHSTQSTITIKLKTHYGKYIVRATGHPDRRGYILQEEIVSLEFSHPGEMHVRGMCNEKLFKRKISFSNREFCDEKYPGYMNIFMNVYCKRPSTIRFCLIALILCVTLYMARGALNGLIGGILALVLFAPMFLANKRLRCRVCMCYRLPRHTCRNYRCARCGLVYYCSNGGVDAREKDLCHSRHLRTCRHSNLAGTELERTVVGLYKAGIELSNAILKFGPGILGLFTGTILIIMLATKADARELTHREVVQGLMGDLSPLIADLEAHGFHPYAARFTPGFREKLETAEEVKNCLKGACNIILKVRTKLIVTKGREFGFSVSPKDDIFQKSNISTIEMNIKFGQPTRKCRYKSMYHTGQVRHQFLSTDTCTQGCGDCLNDIKKMGRYKEMENITDMYEHTHENTASWACDGPGCVAINNGCTCGVCWCQLKSPTHAVMEVISDEEEVEFCIAISGKGWCKRIGREERLKQVTVTKEGDVKDKCPGRIVCDLHSRLCLKGEINKVGEFDNKFGSVQMLSNGKISSKAEVIYTEQCLFAKHRWFEYKQCCKDTQHYIDLLDPVPFIHKNSDLEDGEFILPIKEAGTWDMTLELPPLRLLEASDTMKLTDLLITNCHGCHACDEGGSCELLYRSNLDATLPFSCTGANLDSNTITVKRGRGTASFNVFTQHQDTNITCKIGEFPVNGTMKLIEKPRYPHGDGVIIMDHIKTETSECGGLILCNLSLSWIGGGSVMGVIRALIWVAIISVMAFMAAMLVRPVFRAVVTVHRSGRTPNRRAD